MMRVLAVSTRPWSAKAVRRLRERVIGEPVHLHLVSVAAATEDVAADRVDVLPEVVPRRRLFRRTVPTPTRRDVLARACEPGGALRAWADAADVVLVRDADDCAALRALAAVDTPVLYPASRGALIATGLMPERFSTAPLGDLPTPPPAPTTLLVAPANFAGQGHAWARAVSTHLPDTAALNVRFGALENQFPSDAVVLRRECFDPYWRQQWRAWVLERFSHVLVEANRPVFPSGAATGVEQASALSSAGLDVAMISHGSDVRVPSAHAARERWHPYDFLPPAAVAQMEWTARRNRVQYLEFDGPRFVSTPGLRAFLPDATWVPVVIDTDIWSTERPLLTESRPVVAHVPSNAQKGSRWIDPVLERLAGEGVIDYRRIEGVPFDQMPAIYQAADLVVEQIGAADYGTAACEAMAAGRVVLGRIADEVREHVRDVTGLDLPIVEANPETLEAVVRGLVTDRDRCRQLGADGVAFASAVHDGRRAAAALGNWLHGSRSSSETIDPTSLPKKVIP